MIRPVIALKLGERQFALLNLSPVQNQNDSRKNLPLDF